MIDTRTTCIAAAVIAVASWYVWRDAQCTRMRGGSHARHLTGSAVRGSALDTSLGQVTPDHMLFFGPTARPAGWVPHAMSYPRSPGQEMQRLIYGAPGAYACVIPKSLRGWMFAPPAEVDY